MYDYNKKGEIMRLNKKIFYFSCIISFITLLISIVLNFMIQENKATIFIVNICMNIFAGSIVLIVTSLFDYFIQKRDLLEKIYQEGNKFFRMFNEVQYFEDDCEDFKTFLISNQQFKDLPLKDQKKLYKKQIINVQKRNKETIKKIMDTYIKIAEYDYNNFWNLYKEIDFIFDYKNNKTFLYNNFFHYIHTIVKDIQEEVFHFKIYKESKNGNYLVNSKKIKALQEKIFFVEEIKNYEESQSKKIYKDYPLYQITSNFVTQTSKIVINNVAFNINKIRNKIYDITYNIKNIE